LKLYTYQKHLFTGNHRKVNNGQASTVFHPVLIARNIYHAGCEPSISDKEEFTSSEFTECRL